MKKQEWETVFVTLIDNAKAPCKKKKSTFSRTLALNDSNLKVFPSGTCEQKEPKSVSSFLSQKLWADQGKTMEVKQTFLRLF